MSQAELARRIGASRKWVVGFEQGAPRAELGLALRLAAVLDLEAELTLRDETQSRAATGYGPDYGLRRLRQRCHWQRVHGVRCVHPSLPRGRYCWQHADLAEHPERIDRDPRPPLTIRAAAAHVAAVGGDRTDSLLTWVARFEQDYRYRGIVTRAAMITEEPDLVGEPVVDAFVAALAEYLGHHDGLQPPAWAFDPARVLRPGLRSLDGSPDRRLDDAPYVPMPFKLRGLYVEDHDLEKS